MAARHFPWRPCLAVLAALPVLWFASPGGHPNELRLFLVPLVAAIVLGRGRSFVRDFAPLALGVFAYEWARTLAHRIHPAAFYRPQLDTDRILGPRPHAQRTPAGVALRRAPALARSRADLPALAALRGTAWRPLRRLARLPAALRPGCRGPARDVVRGRHRVPRLPAAPPWLAVRAGLLHGVVRIRSLDGAHEAQGTLQKLFDDNPVAAVPSLHAAYSLLVVLIVRRIWPRLTPLAVVYAVAMEFSRRLPRRALRGRPHRRRCAGARRVVGRGPLTLRGSTGDQAARG